MFWSGNYIAVRELNSLLKEENVTLSQVLEADDVLQECKADNKALIQFLTRPDILAELITLITEEPPKNVELGLQYRHASIACEVLTSHLPTLSDRLSMDTAQMNRLCDFINREPPLNPLLASYFSKTIEMLLERSPKQDWYLYHIVCLRVLDFLKARRDFLPNLLRHLHTSAVADALKCFVRLNDLFNKIVMEWLEEHQFLESLIQIICGTYEPEPLAPGSAQPASSASDASHASDASDASAAYSDVEKGQREESEKAEREGVEKGHLDAQGKEVPAKESPPAPSEAGDAGAPGCVAGCAPGPARSPEEPARTAAERVKGVAAANAAALLCDIILNGCAGEGCTTRPRTAVALVAQLTSARGVRALLQGMFTAPAAARTHALVHGARLLHAMRALAHIHEPESCEARGGVELAVAPHLPLLHTALLQPPEPYLHEPSASEAPADGGGGEALAAEASAEPAGTEASAGAGEAAPPAPPAAPRVPARVGAARLQVAALLAALCGSEVDEVASTMLTLGTPGVLLDMFFAHADNNFLHAHVLAMLQHALANRAYRTQYARHILEECDLLNRLIDVYEENENNRGTASRPRSGYMGHVVLLLRALAPALEECTGPLAERWAAFTPQLHTTLQRHDTPLGGYYPSDNTYEVEGMVEVETALYNLNYNDIASNFDNNDTDNEGESNRNKFLKLANQRMLEQLSSTWDEGEEVAEADADGEGGGAGGDEEGEGEGEGGAPRVHVRDVLGDASPWESTASEEGAPGGEGWAQFAADAFGAPADPFAAADAFSSTDAFANNDAFSSNDAFSTNDAFAARDSFTRREHFEASEPFVDDSFGDGAGTEEFTPFWGYQDKETDNKGANAAEAGMRALRLDEAAEALASPLDALSSSLADNLRTAMSSMAPELVANIVNANMPAPGALPDAAVVDTCAPSATNLTSLPDANASNMSNLPDVPHVQNAPSVASVPEVPAEAAPAAECAPAES